MRGAGTPRTPAPPGFSLSSRQLNSDGSLLHDNDADDNVPLSILILSEKQRSGRLSPEEVEDLSISEMIAMKKINILGQHTGGGAGEFLFPFIILLNTQLF